LEARTLAPSLPLAPVPLESRPWLLASWWPCPMCSSQCCMPAGFPPGSLTQNPRPLAFSHKWGSQSQHAAETQHGHLTAGYGSGTGTLLVWSQAPGCLPLVAGNAVAMGRQLELARLIRLHQASVRLGGTTLHPGACECMIPMLLGAPSCPSLPQH
jgi:hypothetical protein